MSILPDTEKAFDNIQYPFMKKKIQQTRNKREFPLSDQSLL